MNPQPEHTVSSGVDPMIDATRPATNPGADATLDEAAERAIAEAMEGAAKPGDAPKKDEKRPKRERQNNGPARSVTPVGGYQPAIRGPRVVQSGREHRAGKVVSVGPTDIFIEFGPKELGVLPRIQFKEEELPKAGDNLEVVIDKFEKDESLFICSRPGQVQKAEWELLEPGTVVEALVTGTNKGGLELEVAHHRAFMPASQVDVRRIDDLQPFVGQKLKCKVTRVDRSGRGNITLSRRDIVGEERTEALKKLRDSLKEGDTVDGVVRKIMPFGAFVDIGGIDALLHIGDLSHDRVRRVEDVIKEGQNVRVKILKLDWENDRHSLGLKQLTADPFEAGIKDVVDGAELTGRVTKLLEFGAFVEVAPGVEGLVHISELAWSRVAKVSDVVQPNQVIKVKVLKVEKDSRKISLSLKQTLERPADQAPRGGGPGGAGGGRGRGRGDRGEKDTRTPEEILKETPQLRRMREEAKKKHGKDLKSGLGKGLGIGLGDLKL